MRLAPASRFDNLVEGAALGRVVERPSVALVFALMLAGPALAGCIEDLERRQLEAGWHPELALSEAPFAQVRGAPAMLVASGPVVIAEGVDITLTNLAGELTWENDTIALEPMRVHAEEGTRVAAEATGELELSPGEQITVTFVPADDADRRANPDQAWNASVEIQWRYREAGSFDAGRLAADENTTPSRVPDLGVGVVDRSDGQVHGLVFEAIEEEQLPSSIDVTASRLGGGSVETIDELETDVEHSGGTARLTFSEPFDVPEGSGYVVFALDDPNGTASTDLLSEEDALPGPGALALIATLTGIALLARRRL